MMKKTNLQQKLFDSGLIETGDSEDIKAFKKKHRTEYAQAYNKAYREKTIRKTLIFSTNEFKYLEEQANIYNMKLSTFLKTIIFAYLRESFVFIEKEKLSKIENQLREMNERVAESIQYVHLSEEVSYRDIEDIKKTVFNLERTIMQIIEHPPKLNTWIKDHQEKDQLFISKILETIANLLNQNS